MQVMLDQFFGPLSSVVAKHLYSDCLIFRQLLPYAPIVSVGYVFRWALYAIHSTWAIMRFIGCKIDRILWKGQAMKLNLGDCYVLVCGTYASQVQWELSPLVKWQDNSEFDISLNLSIQSSRLRSPGKQLQCLQYKAALPNLPGCGSALCSSVSDKHTQMLIFYHLFQ